MFTKSEVVMIIIVIATTAIVLFGYITFRWSYDAGRYQARIDAETNARKIYSGIEEELRLMKYGYK